MLSIPGIVNRNVDSINIVDTEAVSKADISQFILADAIKKIAPDECKLYHGTRVSVLLSMVGADCNACALKAYGQLCKDDVEVKTGESVLQGQLVNPENEDSISTCEGRDIAIPLYYAFQPTKNEGNYPVLFGIDINPDDERVKKRNFTDIGAFTDCTVKGPICSQCISMIMVPSRNESDTRELIKNTALVDAKVVTFERFLKEAREWWMVSNKSYSELHDRLRGQRDFKHLAWGDEPS